MLPEFVDADDVATVCEGCHKKLNKRPTPELPAMSIANGNDFGDQRRLGLPQLSLEHLIARIRVYPTMLKLTTSETRRLSAADAASPRFRQWDLVKYSPQELLQCKADIVRARRTRR